MSCLLCYMQKFERMRLEEEKKAKCEERRYTVKFLLPNCRLLKATWVLTLEITKGKNDYSFHTLLDKFVAKTTSKEKPCNDMEKAVKSHKTWSW